MAIASPCMEEIEQKRPIFYALLDEKVFCLFFMIRRSIMCSYEVQVSEEGVANHLIYPPPPNLPLLCSVEVPERSVKI